MRLTKAADGGEGLVLDETELGLIHTFSRKKLTEQEVYAFAVRLCDNEIDRDGERFTTRTLEELARLFVGKSGIFDHQWSALGQTARIYRTELVREEGTKTQAGDTYCYLKGFAYMLRTAGNQELIAAIEGGIKKEVSVGCAVAQAVCSVCGHDMADRKQCVHVKGQRYGDTTCWAELTGATDAYEWSFVAVPAQKNAGVMKGAKKGGECMELKTFLQDKPEYLKQMEALEAQAQAGRRYLAGLRQEVARLGGLAEPGLTATLMAGIAERLEEEQLLAMKGAYELRVEQMYPTGVQLEYRGETAEQQGQRDGAFLV